MRRLFIPRCHHKANKWGETRFCLHTDTRTVAHAHRGSRLWGGISPLFKQKPQPILVERIFLRGKSLFLQILAGTGNA